MIWLFTTVRSTLLAVPIVRTVVFRGLFGDALFIYLNHASTKGCLSRPPSENDGHSKVRTGVSVSKPASFRNMS